MSIRTSVPDDEHLEPATPLGEILREFRWTFRLSQKAAAPELRVGISTLQNYETGKKKDGDPINPRPATLELMAGRMIDYAQERGKPLSETKDQLYKRMMVAAGKLSQDALDFYEGRTEPPTDDDLARGDLKVPGLSDIAADSSSSWGELTEKERREISDAMTPLFRQLVEAKLAGRNQRKLR